MVESKVPPDTSTIAADSDNVFIALADDAEPRRQLPEFFFGDGTRDVYTVQDGSQIEFENRELRGGTMYYFFIRLHSSVVSILFLRPFLIVNVYSVFNCRMWTLSMTVWQEDLPSSSALVLFRMIVRHRQLS